MGPGGAQRMYQTFEYSLNDGIGLVRLNRPAKLNSIDPVMVREFGELVAAVRVDKNVRVLVFTGNGRAFYAGADISVLNDAANSGAFMSYIETIQTTFNALDDLDRPTIAAVKPGLRRRMRTRDRVLLPDHGRGGDDRCA